MLVMAGGSGTRLWPLSREALPKHLLPLGPGGVSLLRATVQRVQGVGDTVHVVTAASQVEGCVADLRDLLPESAIIAEPVARGTAPALALATGLIARADPDALVTSVHADSRVGDDGAYRAALLASAGWARTTGGLSTVGLAPTRPATGLGYVEVGDPLPPEAWRAPAGPAPAELARAAGSLTAHRAMRLVEKPAPDAAARFVASGRFLWNLGLFAWPAPVFLDEFRAADGQLAEGVAAAVDARWRHDEAGAAGAYASLPTVAVEPLVFERISQFTVVRATFPWSDLGSWADLHDVRVEAGDADSDDNVVDGDAVVVGSGGCTVEARGRRLVAVVGGDGLVVVDTPDALLVVPAAEAQGVKEVVEHLRANGRRDLL